MTLKTKELTTRAVWTLKNSVDTPNCFDFLFVTTYPLFQEKRNEKNVFYRMLEIWFSNQIEESVIASSMSMVEAGKGDFSPTGFISVDGTEDCDYRNGMLVFGTNNDYTKSPYSVEVDRNNPTYDYRTQQLLAYLVDELGVELVMETSGYGPGNSVIFAELPVVDDRKVVVEIFIRGKKD